MKQGFDSEKYLAEQSQYILERVNGCNKLYLEFGGKLMNDLHAKRVLPGYDENAKIKLLQKLRDNAEIIICVYAGDIERNKMRGDYGITYDLEVFRLIDNFRDYGLDINSVVITRYDDQPAAKVFMTRLERRGIRTYTHKATKGYPTDVDTIVSDEGYGANPYIETTKPIVVVTAPGPGSGKLATCLSQLYHEQKRGVEASYSKFETFPVWNVPLKHPLNIAYEAATADLKDVNMIDSFHLDAYGVMSVNYNRDMEMFPVIKRIIEKITGKPSLYRSPTDMGVNRIGFGIVDDEVVKEASRQEIIRRYFKTACEYKKGLADKDVFQRASLLLDEVGLKPTDRAVVQPARERSQKLSDAQDLCPVVALQLPDGSIVTGRKSDLMSAASACVLNAIKHLACISDSIHLISPVVIEPIVTLKTAILHEKRGMLTLQEILNALCVSAATNPTAGLAMQRLSMLRGCEAHATAMLNSSEEQLLRKLGVEVTCDPEYPSSNLYYN
jgi:uncharacterized protein (UPF0371 family)